MIETAERTSMGAMGQKLFYDRDARSTIRHFRLGPVNSGKVDEVAF